MFACRPRIVAIPAQRCPPFFHDLCQFAYFVLHGAAPQLPQIVGLCLLLAKDSDAPINCLLIKLLLAVQGQPPATRHATTGRVFSSSFAAPAALRGTPEQSCTMRKCQAWTSTWLLKANNTKQVSSSRVWQSAVMLNQRRLEGSAVSSRLAHRCSCFLRDTSQTPWEVLYSKLLLLSNRPPSWKKRRNCCCSQDILVSIEVTGVCIAVGNCKMLLAVRSYLEWCSNYWALKLWE
jgi:hypothetical protein